MVARSRVVPVVVGALAATLLAVAVPAWADAPGSTTATATSATTTDATTTTTASEEPTTTGTTSTVSTEPATSPTTTTAATTTTVATASTGASVPTRTPVASSAISRSLARGCPVTALVLAVPRRLPTLLGPVVDGRGEASLGRLVYPADGSIARGSAVSLGEEACTGRGPTTAFAQLRSLSLFDGAITASSVRLAVGASDRAAVVGLRVMGSSVNAVDAARIPLQRWGYLVARGPRTDLAAKNGRAVSALAVHLVRPHMGLPAGTVVLVSASSLPPTARTSQAGRRDGQARRHRRRAGRHHPLRETPPLGLPRYVFPVAGAASFVDTYGAFRSDVPGNWHHGDDIFAPLGTPVVAVAAGRVNRVGWEPVGGWRLWVRDGVGDEFYYAHLSGYASDVLRSHHVEQGEVIGFVGNTGDAFTTSPHLHFEIHPRVLLHLGYDGAVDPTGYLARWAHLRHVRASRPAHPPLPSGLELRQEAHYVWRELLVARHLLPKRQEAHLQYQAATGVVRTLAEPASSRAPSAAARAGEHHFVGRGTIELLAVIGCLLLVRAAMTVAARRR
jgi:Peptidase family M23